MMVSERFLIEAMGEIHKVGGIALIHAENGELVDTLEQRADCRGTPAS